jgi:hypothetical protein
MKVKQISIKHTELGEIQIYSEIPNHIQQQIGDVVRDYSKGILFYHAEIEKNDDGTFKIMNLSVVRNECIIIGYMNNDKGVKNFITVVTNKKISDDFVVYPIAILSVIYN